MISKLWIQGFRNLSEILIQFDPSHVTFICGDNNQGKTNFLEALYLMGHFVSQKGCSSAEFISFDAAFSVLGADLISGDDTYRVYLKFTRDGQRFVTINQHPVKRVSALAKVCHIEYISADIIRIFYESPEFRRHDIDRFISGYSSDYRGLIQRYTKLIRQKNKVLKTTQDRSLISLFNQQILDLSCQIVQHRHAAYLGVADALRVICETVGLTDFLQIEVRDIFFGIGLGSYDEQGYRKLLLDRLTHSFQKECDVGYSLYGAHRDDFEIFIHAKSLFTYYSRGINRIFAILFKLAELRIIQTHLTQVSPVFLLDDIFAEIDHTHKVKMAHFFESISQVFYTSVLPGDRDIFRQVDVYSISNGVISRA